MKHLPPAARLQLLQDLLTAPSPAIRAAVRETMGLAPETAEESALFARRDELLAVIEKAKEELGRLP